MNDNDFLAVWMSRRGLSKEQLAKNAGVQLNFIERILGGQARLMPAPTARVLEALGLEITPVTEEHTESD